MVFVSKIDTFLLILAIWSSFVMLVGLIKLYKANWLGFSCLLMGLLLVVSITAYTRYTLDGETLYVRSGPFSEQILLADIVSIEETRNPRSAPALSLDRLAIIHKAGRTVISPKNKALFVKELLNRNPAVQLGQKTSRSG